MTKGEIIVNYYYKHRSNVIVKYVDEVTGKEIIENDIITGYEEDTYDVHPKKIDGYEIVEEKLPEDESGKMTKQDKEIIYYYIRHAKIIVNYIDEATNEKIAKQEIINGYQDEEYETKEKEVEHYVLLKDKYPENSKGKFTVEVEKNENKDTGIVEEKVNNVIEVNYYYRKKIFNLKVEKHISNIIINGKNNITLNKKLGKAEIPRKEIDTTNVQVVYTVKIINDGEMAGSGELLEVIPSGMIMKKENNALWTINQNVATLDFEKIEVGEVKEYKVLLDWKNSDDNFGTLTNIAKIINIENKANFEEINTGDNENKADLLISVGTGMKNITKYIMGVFTLLIIFAVLIIKKNS